ncbi:MAG TPA: hypothetical protein VNG90_02340 [Candidatus Acidoferrum sp.]|nr:hypothetical protein [Candidatus Acidoferrum sp.]
MSTSPDEKLISIGKTVLAIYRHPDSWKGGEGSRAGSMVLKVEEIRVGGDAFVSKFDSDINAKAILAWAASVGIKPFQLTLTREQNKAPYVVVPNQYFTNDVLPHLQALTKPDQPDDTLVSIDEQAVLALLISDQQEIAVVKTDDITYSKHPDGGKRVDVHFLIAVGYVRDKAKLGIQVNIEGDAAPFLQTVLPTPVALADLLFPRILDVNRDAPDAVGNIIARLIREIDQEETAQSRPPVLK